MAAACPKCNVILVPVEVRSGDGGRFVGGLLVFIGLCTLVAQVVVGLVLIGLGVLVTSNGGKQPGLMCPNCGAQGATLGEIAYKMRPATPLRKGERFAQIAAVVIAACLLVGLVYLFLTH